MESKPAPPTGISFQTHDARSRNSFRNAYLENLEKLSFSFLKRTDWIYGSAPFELSSPGNFQSNALDMLKQCTSVYSDL